MAMNVSSNCTMCYNLTAITVDSAAAAGQIQNAPPAPQPQARRNREGLLHILAFILHVFIPLQKK